MATLVLTAVGGAIGGPIGAAVGGLLGQAVDTRLFAPKGREGPRLAELKLQTSSYGTPIPKVFGRMRVAGCVIWATDLMEHRGSSGRAKGQPGTTTYSYTASFAVALSGRPIIGVGRIWADGKLLRGVDGDWKSETGFRLHPGGEDQAGDPLIVAHEGVDQAPAHRGVAYAVFEDLQLADFGNRIPSLSFEVIADAGPVTIGAVAADLGEGAIVGAGPVAIMDGFSAYGASARSVLELLGEAAGAWFATVPGGGVEMRGDENGGGAARTIEDAGFGREGARGARMVRAIESVPKLLSVAHYDPARDWQAGVQEARRPGAGHMATKVEMPAALSAGAARGLAEAMLARAEAARVRRRVSLDLSTADVSPGDVIAIAGEGGRWRVAEAALEAMTVTLDLVPLASASVAVPASEGRVLAAADVGVGETIVVAFETPVVDEELLSQPRLTIVAAGTAPGWRRAALLYSLDDGTSWIAAGATAVPGVIGTVLVPPGVAPAELVDRVSAVEVELAHDDMTLVSVEPAAIDRGANLAMLGGELVQFEQATQIASRRWRLSGLWRARRGMSGAAQTGDRFVLLERDTAVTLALPVATIGGRVRVLATGVGDRAGPSATDARVSGVSVAPPAPVHLAGRRLENGDTRVTWVRRSRVGWTWRDGADAPLGEEREAYRARIVSSAGAERLIVLSEPAVIVSAAERAGGAMIEARQLGTVAESAAATLILEG